MVKNNHIIRLFWLLLPGILCLGSCSGTRHLNSGERFYTSGEIKIHNTKGISHKEDLKENLEALLTPKPNTKILGSRPRLWLYRLAGTPKKTTGLASFVKNRLGEAPVLLTDANPKRTTSSLEGFLWGNGYFLAYVENEVKVLGDTKAKVIYHVYPGSAYNIRDIIYPKEDSVLAPIVEEIQKKSILKVGQRYSVDLLIAEQKRIEQLVADHGFYAFNDDYIIYLADSTVGEHQVDLTFNLSDQTPRQARRIYTIDSVNIYPGYSIIRDTLPTSKTEKYMGYNLINNKDVIKKEVLTRHVNFIAGDIYTKKAERYTLEHLYNLGVFKFVNIKFDETDSASLTSNIYLTMLPRKSLRLQIQGVSKSNNFVGPAATLTYSNRNTFAGAELLEISASGSYDVQLGGLNDPPLNAFESNLQTSLTIPRLVIPFLHVDYYNQRFIPKTQIRAGVRLQSRVDVFTLNSFESGYGFTWRETTTKSHQAFPINISYVRLSNVSESFEERLNRDRNLRRSLDNQFIIGGTYNYEFNTKLANINEQTAFRWNNFFFNGALDLSGNLLNLLQNAVGDEPSADGDYKIFRSPYSQYVKLSADFRYYRQLSRKQELATRFIVGAARALGNSPDVPFIKQFSSGGSNSLRAFRARSLGPGAHNAEAVRTETGFILDETGDFKLESSVEYRADLFSALEWAVFVDAGNIWLWKEGTKAGAKFELDDFMTEVAVGTGAGLRLNLGFFILRFDVAFPLRKPWLPAEERWVFSDIDFLDKPWRQSNILYNIAFGYPF